MKKKKDLLDLTFSIFIFGGSFYIHVNIMSYKDAFSTIAFRNLCAYL